MSVQVRCWQCASLLTLALRPRASPSRLARAPHPRASPSRLAFRALAPRPRASPSRLALAPRLPRPRASPSRLALAPLPRASPSRLTLAPRLPRPRASPSHLARAPRPRASRWRHALATALASCLRAPVLSPLFAAPPSTVYDSSVDGLDLRASRALRKGDEVAGGVVDELSVDPDTDSLTDRGVLCGPISLANAACRRCANARFHIRRDGVWVLRIRTPVPRGASIRVPYAQHSEDAEPLACACGVRLTQEEVSEAESGSE